MIGSYAANSLEPEKNPYLGQKGLVSNGACLAHHLTDSQYTEDDDTTGIGSPSKRKHKGASCGGAGNVELWRR